MIDSDIKIYAYDFRFAVIGNRSSERWCAAISTPLRSALSALGVQADLFESDLGECNHVFLRFPDGLVLDATADQFNWCSRTQMPPVYLGPPTVIHEGAKPFDRNSWDELMNMFKKFCPELGAKEVGEMVRVTLSTLPARINPFRFNER